MNKEETDKIRLRASRILYKAIRNGTVPCIKKSTKCVDCGGKATCYDHRDYYQPLKVEPVCKRCNTRRGAAHPVPTDWKDNNGRSFDNFEGGEGDDCLWFSGHCLVEPDDKILDIEQEYYSEFRAYHRDPDLVIMRDEIIKMYRDKKQRKFGEWLGAQVYEFLKNGTGSKDAVRT